MLKGFLDISHDALKSSVTSGDICIDATAGNGYDTEFMASLTGPAGHVYAFDIQQQAIDSTSLRLEEAELKNASLHLAGHERMEEFIPENLIGKVTAITFNLGFLPRSDKKVVTIPETTIPALNSALKLLAPGGILSVAVYTGHDGGQQEGEAVSKWMQELDWQKIRCAAYTFFNKPQAREVLYLVERKKPSRKSIAQNRAD